MIYKRSCFSPYENGWYYKLQIKIKDMLDKYNTIPYNYQAKIGYDTSIQNVILKEMIYNEKWKLVD